VLALPSGLCPQQSVAADLLALCGFEEIPIAGGESLFTFLRRLDDLALLSLSRLT